MSLFLILAQIAAGSAALNFDLAKMMPPKSHCGATNAPANSEIIVCATRHADNDVPIKTMPEETLLPKAEFKLFGKVRGKVAGEQGNVGQIPTNRAMITLSMPF